MIEVLSTNDPVKLNFAEAVLRDAGVETVTLDAHTAATFGGAVPWIRRRLLVREEDAGKARLALAAAMPKDE
ncbi:MAG: DUF2007 domain-containing protein [Oceanicaulis sp.]|nr:DUF2007 domain-containing protein [Oceanicaulis sp.]